MPHIESMNSISGDLSGVLVRHSPLSAKFQPLTLCYLCIYKRAHDIARRFRLVDLRDRTLHFYGFRDRRPRPIPALLQSSDVLRDRGSGEPTAAARLQHLRVHLP